MSYKVRVVSRDKFEDEAPIVEFESRVEFRSKKAAEGVAERFHSFLGLEAEVYES